MKILTHKSCIVSAKRLRDSLQKFIGRKIIVTTDSEVIRGPFIRYGCSDPVNIDDTKYNSAKFCNLVANKAMFSKLLTDNKLYTPIFNRNKLPTQFPVLIRTTLNSSGGKGIIVCADEASFKKHWKPQSNQTWTPFIKTSFELRVHILGGKVVKILKKIYRPDLEQDEENEDDVPETQEPELPIRNLDKGYHYKVRPLETYPKILDLIKNLDPLLGGKFYTLDVGWDAKNKKYLVFEANSGSGLNTKTVDLYADYLSREYLSE